METLMILVLSGAAACIWYFVKRKSGLILAKGFYTSGKVLDYKPKPFDLAGDWAGIYPFVAYLDENGLQKCDFVEYPVKHTMPFAKGQEIELVKHKGKFYYKGALQ